MKRLTVMVCLLEFISTEEHTLTASASSSAKAAAAIESREREIVTLKDIAIGIVSGRGEYFHPVASAVLRYAPRGVLLKASGKCSCNFRAGFAALVKKHPDAKWYYVTDDDVMIMLEKLVKMLREYGENKPVVLAGHTQTTYKDNCGDGTEAPWVTSDPEGRCMFGGTGIIMSGPMVRKLALDEPCECLVKDSDLEMTCFVGRSWSPSFRFESLRTDKGFGNVPQHGDDVALDPFERMVVVHRVHPNTLGKLASRNGIVGNATRTAKEVIADAVPLLGACCGKTPEAALVQQADTADTLGSQSGVVQRSSNLAPMVRRESD